MPGDLAYCSRGSLGLIVGRRFISRPGGSQQVVYAGIHLTSRVATIGSPWQSRKPQIIGHISQFLPEIA